MLRGRTVIVIAHRLKTIKEADNIMVLENGSVAECGDFETLMLKDGAFKMLWQSQTKDNAD